MQKGARTGLYSDAADMKITVYRCAQAALHTVLYYAYSARTGHATTLSLTILTSLCNEVAGARSLVVLK